MPSQRQGSSTARRVMPTRDFSAVFEQLALTVLNNNTVALSAGPVSAFPTLQGSREKIEVQSNTFSKRNWQNKVGEEYLPVSTTSTSYL